MIRSIVNRFLKFYGYELSPLRGKKQYIDAVETVNAARAKGMSVCDYVEFIWDQKGLTARVIEKMKNAGCFDACVNVCEIGPGTGRYLERVLEDTSPERYDIYEIATDWAKWLSESYSPIICNQPADGHSLKPTPSNSCNLVHAHGVFVYLSFLNAFEYFDEMIRVCSPGGYIVFDFYPDENFDADTIKKWISSKDRYPVILPCQMLRQYFISKGFVLKGTFENKHGQSFSRYLIYKNNAS